MSRARTVALLATVGGLALAVLLVPDLAWAKETLRIDLADGATAGVGTALKMILLLTALSLAPAILLATTCFIRIAVVFGFLRSALGTQNLPPNQVMMGLALFLTIAVMAPTGTQLWERGLGPYLDGQLSAEQAWARGSVPLRDFMLRQTREKDLELFYDVTRAELPATPADVRIHLLVPAFIISELRTAFEMGFMIFLPFLLLDLITASVLMSMGMVMLPPALISLPIKVMLFVVADGWNLLVGSLVRSFG